MCQSDTAEVIGLLSTMTRYFYLNSYPTIHGLDGGGSLNTTRNVIQVAVKPHKRPPRFDASLAWRRSERFAAPGAAPSSQASLELTLYLLKSVRHSAEDFFDITLGEVVQRGVLSEVPQLSEVFENTIGSL
jgi:hypothetical protein